MFTKKCLCVLGVFAIALLIGSVANATPILVHQWAFDGNLSDSSGSGNVGTLSGGTETYVAGKFGQQAISLAAGQSVANTAAANLPTAAADAWSMNFWFKGTDVPQLAYVAGFGSATGGSDGVRGIINYSDNAPGTAVRFWGNARDAEIAQQFQTDDFHMITATYDGVSLGAGLGCTVTVYYDGVQKYQGPTNLNVPLSDAPAQVQVNATSAWGKNAAGAYQELTIWSGTLTGDEVTQLYTTNQIPEPSTIVLFGLGLLGLLAYAWRRRK